MDASTLHWIDEKTSLPLSVRGTYIATTAPYLNIWCLQYFPLIQRRQRNRHTPLPSNLPARLYTVPRVHPGCHPGHGTNCNGQGLRKTMKTAQYHFNSVVFLFINICGEHLLRMWHLLRSTNGYHYTIITSTKWLDTYGSNPPENVVPST